MKKQLKHNAAMPPMHETRCCSLTKPFPLHIIYHFLSHFLKPLRFCSLLLGGFKGFRSASRTFMECKYKYKRLSPIKIKFSLCVLQCFLLLRDVLHHPEQHMPKPSLIQLSPSFFYPVLPCRQSLCSCQVTPDHLSPHGST